MSVPALARGLRILELVAATGEPVSFSQIVAHLDLANASVSRLVQQLIQSGYLERDIPSGRYLLGATLLDLLADATSAERLRRVAAAVLHRLVQQAGNTAILIHWAGAEMRCLAKRTHPASIPMHPVGHGAKRFERRPWGWVFLATRPKAEQRRALDQLDDAELRRKVARAIRAYGETGYAVDLELIQPMVRRIAAPVFNAQGRVTACIAVGGNPLTLPDDRVSEIGRLTVQHALALTDAIASHGTSVREQAA